jgi:hypothetical protein
MFTGSKSYVFENINNSGQYQVLNFLRYSEWESIRHGLAHGTAVRIDPLAYAQALQRPGAGFVTLHRRGALRGCIGHLEATRPLVADIADSAFAAAFRDPRFPPLTESELDDLELEISVLTPAEPMRFTDEADLCRQLQPGVDGLVLEDRGARGTFLPSVWESLPEPADFIIGLKQKAGLPRDYWSDTLRVSRYRTQSFAG